MDGVDGVDGVDGIDGLRDRSVYAVYAVYGSVDGPQLCAETPFRYLSAVLSGPLVCNKRATWAQLSHDINVLRRAGGYAIRV